MFGTSRGLLWGTVLVLVLSFTSGNTLNDGEEDVIRGEGEEFGEYIWQKRTAALAIATILIFLSIFFEFGKEKIEETTSPELKPVIDHLFQELTVLGFLSLLTFVALQIGKAMGNPLSEEIFKEEELLSELLEFIHMGLFANMIVFIIIVVLLIRLGEREKATWRESEELATNHQERLVTNYEAAMKKTGTGQDKLLWRILPFLNPTTRKEEAMNYYALRQEFISPRDSTQPRLPQDFKFNLYLSFCMGEVLGRIVEIPPLAWVGLEIFFIIAFFVSFLPYNAILIMYYIWGWLLLLWMGLVAMNLNRIKLKLIPRYQTSTSVNEMSSLLSLQQFEKPQFLNKRLQRRTTLGRMIFGNPANKHQLLFHGNTIGPYILIANIRFILLLSAIYIGGLLFVILTFPNPWYLFFLIPLAFLPIVIIGYHYAPRVVRLWVIVCNIEMLKNQEFIQKVLRNQRTERSLRALKVLQLMKLKTGSLRPSDAEAGGGLSESQTLSQLPAGKREDITEVFKLFDTDESGTIDAAELVNVFQTLGQDMTEEEAKDLILELDEDGDGELSLEEFADYFQKTFDVEKTNPETLVKNMFSIFDVDEHGEISRGDFASVLLKLGRTLTTEDIDAVVDEVDINGDGKISFKEFEIMVRKHLFRKRR